MPDDLVKIISDCPWRKELSEAITHEDRIRYFIETDISNVTFNTQDYNIHITESGLASISNPFIGWVKSILRIDNYKSFLKFYRKPLPTVALIQDNIIPELKKVFDSRNSIFDYYFNDEAVKTDALTEFSENGYQQYVKNKVWSEMIYRHNSIVITDIENSDNGKTYRYIVPIRSVMAIYLDTDGKIEQIVFRGKDRESGEKRAYHYTKEKFVVYKEVDKTKFEFFYEKTHDLKSCPADFISQETLKKDKSIIRKSLFSNYIEKFEKYVFYYCLYKMLIPHGALPVITHYRQKKEPCNNTFEDGTHCKKGYLANSLGYLGGKDNLVNCPMCNPKSIIQAGSVITMDDPVSIALKLQKGGDEKIPVTDLNANFVRFHHAPVDILKWIKDYLDDLEAEIIIKITGSEFETAREDAKNIDQIKKGLRSIKNTLLGIGDDLSTLRKSIDDKYFILGYGDRYDGSTISYGTDWYLESEKELLELQGQTKNPIEFASIQKRINETLYRHDEVQLTRIQILYSILPYSNKEDFKTAVDSNQVDPIDFELQTKFNYYIRMFEAKYGNIVTFVNTTFPEGTTMDKRIDFVNEVIRSFITPVPVEIET